MLFSLAKILHILAGFTALLIFWIPLVTKKGGSIHRRIGWVYIGAMTVVSISAMFMGIWRIYFFGAPRLLQLSSVSPLLWFLPTLIMVPIILGLVRHYKGKFSRT